MGRDQREVCLQDRVLAPNPFCSIQHLWGQLRESFMLEPDTGQLNFVKQDLLIFFFNQLQLTRFSISHMFAIQYLASYIFTVQLSTACVLPTPFSFIQENFFCFLFCFRRLQTVYLCLHQHTVCVCVCVQLQSYNQPEL